MIIAISIERDYKDYAEFSKILQSLEKNSEFSEFTSYLSPLLTQYRREFKSPVQFFKIEWDNIVGAKNIKHSKFDKPYNADAPRECAEKIVKYATHYCKIGKGDYNINMLAMDKKLPELTHSNTSKKTNYKF